MANVAEAADEIQTMIQNWIDANDLDQTLEDLHQIPRAIQEAFSHYAEQLRESTNLAERLPDAIEEAGAQMSGIADSLQEAIRFGVQQQ